MFWKDIAGDGEILKIFFEGFSIIDLKDERLFIISGILPKLKYRGK